MHLQGCIQSWGRVLGRQPEGIKSLAKDGRPQDNHPVKGRTRPAHAGASQALFELLDATFDATRANRQAIRSELDILHAAGVFTEVIAPGIQTVALELFKDQVDFAFEQQRLEVLRPAQGGGRVISKTSLSGLSQMLAGMKPIDNLDGTRE